jgi:hypothetical protein
MKRWVALAAGICITALAFVSVTHVENTREGLIAEVITEFSALIGISLTLYGLLAGTRRPAGQSKTTERTAPNPPPARSVRDLITGGGGLLVAFVLLTGIALSSGIQWAALGGVVLLPMIAGSIYLCVRFTTAPVRSWKLELRKPDEQS